MASHLELVLLMQQYVQVLSQTCYTDCLQKPTEHPTAVNVMMFDDMFFGREWYERKTAEFNALYTTISVTLKHVSLDDMVNEARTDLEQGTNFYHAYLVPFLNLHGGLSLLSDRLMDMSPLTVANVNSISWPSIGRFFRSRASLYEGKVLSLPLCGDFVSLYYRQDIFRDYEVAVPRTLEEYVRVSQALNGTDFDGDGEMDYGSCFPHAGESSGEYFLAWITQTLQYRGTSQGTVLDTDTLAPLFENLAVKEAIRLWKQVAGPPEVTSGIVSAEVFELFLSGRCAMTIGTSTMYTVYQSDALAATTGIAHFPGSDKVWWRDGGATVQCNTSFCRHATKYHDGLVVNHAPGGQSVIDGAINGQVGRPEQLAAFTFLTWLMNDANMLEAVVTPPSWPNLFPGAFVKPSLLVASEWKPHGWLDPAVSLYCATMTSNLEHPNAVVGWRLPIARELYDVAKEITTAYWRGTGDFEGLDDEAGAILAAALITTAFQRIIDRGDRESLLATFQKSLNIFVAAPAETPAREVEVFPVWAVHAVVGILSGTVCLAVSVFVCWLTSTLMQQRRLRARQEEAWEEILDDAEVYTTSLRCPMALVSAADLLAFGCLTQFEAIRDSGKQRVLDTMEKIADFRKEFVIVFLSHHWLAWTSPDPQGVHHKTMMAAVDRVSDMANVGIDKIFLWVDFCSIPQDVCGFKSCSVLLVKFPFSAELA